MANKKRVPSLCLHKASGRAVVRLDGKDIYLGAYGTQEAQAAYDRLITEWLQRGRALPPWAGGHGGENAQVPQAGLSVAELVLAYKEYTDEYYRDSPAEREKIRLATRHLRLLYGLTPASAFGPLALKAVREQLLGPQKRVVKARAAKKEAEEKEPVPERFVEYRLSRRTINMRIDAIKRLFAWAAENELVPASVWHGLQAVKGLRKGRSGAPEPRKVCPVDDSHVEAALPFLSRPLRAMVELQRLTGARSGELCIMRLCDIDRSRHIWAYRPATHKNAYRGLLREVLIGPRGQKVLEPFLGPPTGPYVFSPREATTERYQAMRAARKSKVPPSQVSRKKARPKKQPGERYTVYSYRRAVQTACKRAGVPPWHPHQLRHSAATAIRREHGVEAARVVLGHATAFTTEMYTERDHKRATEVMAAMG
jgi:integrase